MATATYIIRSPAVILSGKGTVSDQKTASPFQIPQFSMNRRRFTALFASLHDDNNTSDGSNKIRKAVGLEKLFEDSPYDVSKDSPLHPRPLTSTQLPNTISDGPRLRVAYQGVRGAYSEAAAEKAYPNCEPVPCDQFDAAFELAVHHCLLANHGVRVEDLKRVLSHPQALAQCEYTLTKIGLSREAIDDTALAAKHVAFEKLKDTGAVASSMAAKIYGLNILAENIQDDCDNVTRFLMLAREPIIPGVEKPFKTSIVFSLEEGPGVLFKALAVFALRQINLTKIESRPLRNQPLRASDDNNNGSKYFDYLFYVDFEASMAEERAQNALRHLKEFATFLRVLGSYAVDTTML
ncbi:hypothetical protein V6N13_058509 [Hibiscus sabdariffa]